MFSCSASLRCPACREPLAPKGVEVGCGSCGQKYPVDLAALARPNAALKGYAMLALLGCVGLLGVATWRQLELVERDCQLAATREQQARVLAELRACGERSRLAQLSRAKAEAAGRQSAGAPDSSAVTTEVASEADQEELRSDIRFLEDLASRVPDSAELHYRLSLDYDRMTGDPAASGKCFEHAKAAIKLDPAYKKKFQPMIRNSRVAKQVAEVIHRILEASEARDLPDEEAARYADQIGKLLGQRNDAGEPASGGGSPGAGPSSESLKEMIKDPAKRQKLREMWDSRKGAAPSAPPGR